MEINVVRYAALLMVALLAGCARQEIPPIESDYSLGKIGLWVGDLNIGSTVQDVEDLEGWKLLLQNCGDDPSIYLLSPDNMIDKIYDDYQRHSHNGNHIIFNIFAAEDYAHDGTWVETQVWSFVVVSENEIFAQWNRTISNPTLEPGEKERAFGYFGFSNMKWLSGDCSSLMEPQE